MLNSHTVFIGRNGVGKTSLAQALCIGNENYSESIFVPAFVNDALPSNGYLGACDQLPSVFRQQYQQSLTLHHLLLWLYAELQSLSPNASLSLRERILSLWHSTFSSDRDLHLHKDGIGISGGNFRRVLKFSVATEVDGSRPLAAMSFLSNGELRALYYIILLVLRMRGRHETGNRIIVLDEPNTFMHASLVWADWPRGYLTSCSHAGEAALDSRAEGVQ